MIASILFWAAIVGVLTFLVANIGAIAHLLAKREDEAQRLNTLKEKLKLHDTGSGVLWIEQWFHNDE